MRKVIVLTIVFILSLNLHAWSNNVIELGKKEELSFLLNNLTIIAELKEIPYAVRLITIPRHGECGKSPETCPKTELYVGISSFDEYPEQSLYKVGESYGWEFIRWVSIPKTESQEEYVVIEIKKKCINKENIGISWWRECLVKLFVNLRNGRVSLSEGK